MVADESDSGVDIMSHEESPSNPLSTLGGNVTGDEPEPPSAPSLSSSGADSGIGNARLLDGNNPSIEAIEDTDDEFDDETLTERLLGLTEMFPESFRESVVKLTQGTVSGIKFMYGASRVLAWGIFSSALILIAPVVVEVERSQVDEMQKTHQRQILLGPGAAMSGPAGPAFMPPPIPPSTSQ